MNLDKYTFLIGIYERLQLDDIEYKHKIFKNVTTPLLNHTDIDDLDIENFNYVLKIVDEPIFKTALFELAQERPYTLFIVTREYLKQKYDEVTTFKIIEEFLNVLEYYNDNLYHYMETIIEYIDKEKRNSTDKSISTLANLHYIKGIRSSYMKPKDDYDDLPF